jgi:hypothetical protein
MDEGLECYGGRCVPHFTCSYGCGYVEDVRMSLTWCDVWTDDVCSG